MTTRILRNLFTGLAGATLSALSLLWGQSAFGEVQYSIDLSMSSPDPGASTTFDATANTSTGNGTFYNTYSGINRYVLGSTVSGRFTGLENTARYGVNLGSFQIFQSFLTDSSLTVGNAGTLCPSGSTTFGFINVRMRSPIALRGPHDASSSTFKAGGVFTLNTASSPPISGSSYFNLAGPTLTSASDYTATAVNACSSGKRTFQSAGNSPWDSYFYMFSGVWPPTGSPALDGTGVIVGSHGSPIVSVLSPITDLTAPRMALLAGRIMSGLYQDFSSPTVSSAPIYLYPDGAGTTFTLRQITDVNDPATYSNFGTLTCTSRNSPTTGFCSGTLTRQGVSGSGKAVCQVSTRAAGASDVLTCIAQRPDNNSATVTIMARNHDKSVLAVTLPSPAFTLASAQSASTTATVRNMTGNRVTNMQVPTNPGDRLSAPFSLPTPFTGAGGTCGTELDGYQSCNLTVDFSPAAPGTYNQILRVQYNNQQIASVNATANVIGTVSLVSIVVTPTGPFTAGGTQQFTATAHYSDTSTQDVTNAVVWASSATAYATINSSGLATFVAAGNTDITATVSGVTGTRSITVNPAAQPPANDFAISEPSSNVTIMRGEPYNIRYTGGADPDSIATVNFYVRTTNAGCDSGGIGNWTSVTASPSYEGFDTGATWETQNQSAGTYYVCGVITDGTTTRYAVSANTVTLSTTASARLITLNPSATSEKSYKFVMDQYEATLSTSGSTDNVNAYASNTTTKIAESRSGAFGASGTVAWAAAYKACENRGTGWRLPTAQETYFAMAGTPNYNGTSACNSNSGSASTTIPYGSGGCVSSFGVYDLIGNLYEWVDLNTTFTTGTLSASAIRASTIEGSAFVGKQPSSYNSLTVPSASSSSLTSFSTQLGVAVTSGGDVSGAANFTTGDLFAAPGSSPFSVGYMVGGFYSSGNNTGGKYNTRMDRTPQNMTAAAIGFRCAKSAYTVPSIRITAPAAPNVVSPSGNNITIDFQAYDSDDNADIALYYRQYSSNAGCSGNPAANGWTLIDDTLKENTNTSKTFDVSALSDGFYFVCARIRDGKNTPQYAVSNSVFKKGSQTDSPTMTVNEPTGNNDTIFENQSFTVTFTSTDYDSNASISLYYKSADSTGCSGTPTSQGWTAMTTTPASVTENSDTSAIWDVNAINNQTYPRNFYVCASASDGSTTAYSNSGSNYVRVLPLGRCKTESGNFSTANGGCYNSSTALTYSVDSLNYNNSTATFAGSATYCSNLNTAWIGGYNDWRRATVAELQALATAGIANLIISDAASNQVWSSQNPGGPNATAVTLSTGTSANIGETSSINAICVRP